MKRAARSLFPKLRVMMLLGFGLLCAASGMGQSNNFKKDMVSALQGNIEAELRVASAYQRGDGITTDAKQAVQWYAKAAGSGNPEAAVHYGVMLYRGEGTERDLQKAFQWFQRAAVEQVPEAMNDVALMYFRGEGVMRDPVEGVKWMKRAADMGFVPAKAQLGVAYWDGVGTERNREEAIKLFREAARKHNPAALFGLGLRLRHWQCGAAGLQRGGKILSRGGAEWE